MELNGIGGSSGVFERIRKETRESVFTPREKYLGTNFCDGMWALNPQWERRVASVGDAVWDVMSSRMMTEHPWTPRL